MPEQTNPLVDLKDIILPTTYETALPAIGWWLLGVLVILSLSLLLFAAWRFWNLDKPRREALLKLKQQPATLAELNLLMKRLALSYYPRQQVASLNGQAWLVFLDSTSRKNQAAFSELQDAWQQALYSATPSDSAQQCIQLGEQWIKQLRPPLSMVSIFGFGRHQQNTKQHLNGKNKGGSDV